MEGFIVSVTVGAFSVAHIHSADFEIIMRVSVGARRQFFQDFFHIGDEKRFGLIDDYRHGGMQALDVDHAFFDSGFSNYFLDFFRHVDKIKRGGGFQVDDVVDDFHGGYGKLKVMTIIITKKIFYAT